MVTPVEISVVMSVYNGARYLKASIDSILKQEGVNFEFIVINDGSTDESGDILNEYTKQDNRIRAIHQENQGLTKALIKGCSQAQGKYIARQDVGDLSHPKRLAIQKVALDADKEISFVSCWTEFCGPELEFLYLLKGTGKARLATYIIDEKVKYGVIDGPSHHGSVMFRRDSYLKVCGYRANFYYGQDWDLWYRIAEIGKFQVIETPLYKARVYPTSISSFNKTKQETLGKLSLLALLHRRKGLSEEAVLIEASTIKPEKKEKVSGKEIAKGFYFIGECLRRNNNPKAYFYLKETVKKYPMFWKALFRILQFKFLRCFYD